MALEHDSDSALAIAVRTIGSQSAFGRLIGKRQSVVNDWLREERLLPAELVLMVEKATGISRHELRPDIYPIEDQLPGSSPGEVPPVASSPAAGGAGLAGARA